MRVDFAPEKLTIDESLPAQLIIYDGVCNLCIGWVNFIIKRDHEKRFKFLSAQSQLGQKVMKTSGLRIDDFNSNLYIENGTLYFKMDTVIKIAKRLGGVWGMVAILQILPRSIRNWLYDRIAKNRYKFFGRNDHCMVPSASVMERFIS